ncbi:hypothetical protein L596_020528 [Steinernema carpocapsae]|uniref:Uncharacterized protein n=1 Tax=Steinernema carpocapsae TaxID=34508 RepID=A0A4U5MU07_STECR|nr:hypothetical protein L596_020528 [Steinernema carpocapsae]
MQRRHFVVPPGEGESVEQLFEEKNADVSRRTRTRTWACRLKRMFVEQSLPKKTPMVSNLWLFVKQQQTTIDSYTAYGPLPKKTLTVTKLQPLAAFHQTALDSLRRCPFKTRARRTLRTRPASISRKRASPPPRTEDRRTRFEKRGSWSRRSSASTSGRRRRTTK